MYLRIYIMLTTLFFSMPIFASGLGKIVFPTSSTHQAAKTYFEQGVLLLHNFEYDRARSAFLQAEKIDPNFALAYWGEAMTYNQPVWNDQDLVSAKKALTKLAATDAQRIEKVKTPKEKGWMKAINLLFGKGTKVERDAAYADFMQQLYRQYPNDDEVAAFYALSLLGKTEGVRDFRTYMQAAAIAEEITQRSPKHPGGLHYAIHSYDDPIHAPLGLRAARVYAKLASDSTHALHMPSHIYLTLGLWDDVIASNQDAWNVGFKQNKNKRAADYTIHDFHALKWLVYGYLQKQQYRKAYNLVKMTRKIAEESQTPMAKAHYALMRADYIVESRDWHTDLKSLDMQGVEPISRASDIYANALIALNKNLRNADVTHFVDELEKLSEMVPSNAVAICGRVEHFSLVTVPGILVAKITALQLRAQIQLHRGNLKAAMVFLRKALQLEAQMPVDYGPPAPIKPTHELLAEVLFLDQQYVDAYKEYMKELERNPNRTISVEGLKKMSRYVTSGAYFSTSSM